MDVTADLVQELAGDPELKRISRIISLYISGHLGSDKVALFVNGPRGDLLERANALGTGKGFGTRTISGAESFIKWVCSEEPPAHLDNFFTAKTDVTLRDCGWMEEVINSGFSRVSALSVKGRTYGLVFYAGRKDGRPYDGHSRELLETILRVGSAAIAVSARYRSALARAKSRNRFSDMKERSVTRRSFELNTPLTVLKSALWSIDSVSAAEGLMIEMAKDAVRNLESRVSELANISELELEHSRVNLRKVDISNLVEEETRKFLPEIDEKAATVEFRDKIFKEIPADRAKMGIALSGILAYTIERVERGGTIEISVCSYETGPGKMEGREIDTWKFSEAGSADSASIDSIIESVERDGRETSRNESRQWIVIRVKGGSDEMSPLGSIPGILPCDGHESDGDMTTPDSGASISIAQKIVADHGGRLYFNKAAGDHFEHSIWLPYSE